MAITFPDEACAVTCTVKHIYSRSVNPKTKYERKAFPMTLFPL